MFFCFFVLFCFIFVFVCFFLFVHFFSLSSYCRFLFSVESHLWSKIPGCHYSVLLLCWNADWLFGNRDVFRRLGPKEMHLCIQRYHGMVIKETMRLCCEITLKKDTWNEEQHWYPPLEEMWTPRNCFFPTPSPSHTVTLIFQYFCCVIHPEVCPAQFWPFPSFLVSRSLHDPVNRVKKHETKITPAICYSFCPVLYRRLSTTFPSLPFFASYRGLDSAGSYYPITFTAWS